MKITITKRNHLVEKYLWCIETVMGQNRRFLERARLDLDDVYQDLAVRLIGAVACFDDGEETLEQHILSQLRQELRRYQSTQRRYGIQSAPHNVRSIVISLDALADSDPDWEIHIA